MDYYKQEKGKRVKLEGDELAAHISTQPTTEQEFQDMRAHIKAQIYRIAHNQTEQLRSNYSVTESIRWTEDREAINNLNWAHFSARAGSTMTGQQYAETRVVPKIAAGNIFLDGVIAKRTDLLVALASTTDEALGDFDYTSMWDDASDYKPPHVEVVTSTAWALLMDSFSWNYKLF